MKSDGFVNLLMNLFPPLDIMRGKPAPNIARLQIGIEPLCELLIFGRVTDET